MRANQTFESRYNSQFLFIETPQKIGGVEVDLVCETISVVEIVSWGCTFIL
jgi:hypothetical protein